MATTDDLAADAAEAPDPTPASLREEWAGIPTIFVVTVMTEARDRPMARRDGSVHVVPNRRDSRSWGWYREAAAAVDALHRNHTDLHETIYDWAVVEEIPEGVCPDVLSERWFRFDRSAGGYRPAERPADLAGTVGFSLG